MHRSTANLDGHLGRVLLARAPGVLDGAATVELDGNWLRRSGSQRVDALAQALHDLHDVPTVGADQLMQEFVLKEREHRGAAPADGVAEAGATVTGAISNVDDRQFEGAASPRGGSTGRRTSRAPAVTMDASLVIDHSPRPYRPLKS
jgi:hypothetical protein